MKRIIFISSFGEYAGQRHPYIHAEHRLEVHNWLESGNFVGIKSKPRVPVRYYSLKNMYPDLDTLRHTIAQNGGIKV